MTICKLSELLISVGTQPLEEETLTVPVPSSEKGGGLGVGLATRPRKTLMAKEMTNISTTNTPTRGRSILPNMMASEETSNGVRCPIKKSIFTAKSTTCIATWNVRTLFQASRLVQLLKEFDHYQLDILGLGEVRWNGTGSLVKDGKTVLYSCLPERHEQAVG